jgi:hypothetical protein
VELVWALDQITLIFLWLQVLFIISMNIALGLGGQYTYKAKKITTTSMVAVL